MLLNKKHFYKEKIAIVSGPSGAGKSTVCAHLLKKHPQKLTLSVSETTRQKRKAEQSGRHYLYISPETFQKRIERFHYYEWFYLHGHYYGTPRTPMDALFRVEKIPLLDVDVNGMQRVSQLFPNHLSIFIAPVSLDQLKTRLRKRSTDTDAQIQIRMETAQKELKKQALFQQVIINDQLEETLKKAEEIMMDYINA
jgi:guanylate kinase